MIETKIIEVPARTYSKVEAVICDLCHTKNRDNDCWPSARNYYNVHHTTVALEHGSNSPDGGMGEKTIIDICPTCFKEKLLPWLETQGAKPRIEKWDW
jgi:hypothetical protein